MTDSEKIQAIKDVIDSYCDDNFAKERTFAQLARERWEVIYKIADIISS